MSLTLQELIEIRDSLKECKPDIEEFSWGPTLNFAYRRKDKALRLLNREIRNTRKTDGQTDNR